jgi:hypothetical protein
MRLGEPRESQRGGMARVSDFLATLCDCLFVIHAQSHTPSVRFCPYVRLLSGGKALPVKGFYATPTVALDADQPTTLFPLPALPSPALSAPYLPAHTSDTTSTGTL